MRDACGCGGGRTAVLDGRVVDRTGGIRGTFVADPCWTGRRGFCAVVTVGVGAVRVGGGFGLERKEDDEVWLLYWECN